jgi:2,3-dihydroxy-p-cumate/2,3-dihydroxybenzoate 3,4-dioxygenase
MINLHELRYVRLGTRDIDAAAKYASDILGLQLVRREGGWAYLRSDERDHTLVYFEGDPNDHTIAFDVLANEVLEHAGTLLEQNGFAVHGGSRDECDQRRVPSFISFKDPSGNRIELVFGALHSGRRYFPSRDAGITGFSHVGLRTSDPRRDEIFWTTLCNARVSDWIGSAPLLRIDEVHHRIALLSGVVLCHSSTTRFSSDADLAEVTGRNHSFFLHQMIESGIGAMEKTWAAKYSRADPARRDAASTTGKRRDSGSFWLVSRRSDNLACSALAGRT